MSGSTRRERIRGVLRLAQPPIGRFVPGLVWGVLSAAAAVSLLAVSGWLIVSASIVDSLVPLSIAVVGVRFFAVSRAVTRYLERLSGHDAALRQLASTRADMVRRLTPLSPAGLGATDRGQMLTALVDDVENLQNLPLRVVQPLGVAAVVAVGAVGFIAFVSPPAALTLALCLWSLRPRRSDWAGCSARVPKRSCRYDGPSSRAALVDYFGSLDVLLAYGAEAQARERIAAADAALRRVVDRASFAQAIAAGVVSAVAGAASVWALAAAAPGLIDGSIDGPWLAVAVLVPMVVFEIFGAVPVAAASWRSVRSSAERIVDALPERMPDELRSDGGRRRRVRRYADDPDAWRSRELARRRSCAHGGRPRSAAPGSGCWWQGRVGRGRARWRLCSSASSACRASTGSTGGTLRRCPGRRCVGPSASASRAPSCSMRTSARTCSSRATRRPTTNCMPCSTGSASGSGPGSAVASTRGSATAARSCRVVRSQRLALARAPAAWVPRAGAGRAHGGSRPRRVRRAAARPARGGGGAVGAVDLARGTACGHGRSRRAARGWAHALSRGAAPGSTQNPLSSGSARWILGALPRRTGPSRERVTAGDLLRASIKHGSECTSRRHCGRYWM